MLALKHDTDSLTQWIPHQKSAPSLNDVNHGLSAIVDITSVFLHLFLLLQILIIALCNSSFVYPTPVVVDFTAFLHYVFQYPPPTHTFFTMRVPGQWYILHVIHVVQFTGACSHTENSRLENCIPSTIRKTTCIL